MKHLTILLTMAITFTGLAQNNLIEEYPWNPDSNFDNFIGVSDLTGFLSVFGEQFGSPPQPCTYDGTAIEDLLVSVSTGGVVLDSMRIEYQVSDVVQIFLEGCPDPVSDTLVFAQSVLLANFESWDNYWQMEVQYPIASEADFFRFSYQYNPQSGYYRLEMYSQAINVLGFANDGFFSGNSSTTTGWWTLPWPSSFSYTEDGLSAPWLDGWGLFADHLHILPYWHYAED